MNEAELLFTDILSCSRQELLLNRNRVLDIHQCGLIGQALKRRACGEPVQYILGKTIFIGLEFKVNPSVFIPRPETEILVESVLNYYSPLACSESPVNILDIGTGSGCIAVSLAKLLRNVKITATDISAEALEVAKYNASLNKVNINFLEGDLFRQYAKCATTQYDIIVSNPPYIPTHEIALLQPEVQYEPRVALDGGKDGMDFYRRIIETSPDHLKKDGFLAMEIGFGQRPGIEAILQESRDFEIIGTVKDYNNIDRVIIASKRS